MLGVWGALLPADRLTVVTVPPSGSARDDLWQRFCNAAGVSADGTTVDDSAFGNPALGYGSVELLRRINAAGLKQVRPSAYRKVVRYVARNHLIPLRSGESRPQLDRATADFALDLNARTLAAVREHAVLVGRSEELPTEADTSALPDAPPAVPEAEVAAAAEAARLGMVQLVRRARPRGARRPARPGGRRRHDRGEARLRHARRSRALIRPARDQPSEPSPTLTTISAVSSCLVSSTTSARSVPETTTAVPARSWASAWAPLPS